MKFHKPTLTKARNILWFSLLASTISFAIFCIWLLWFAFSAVTLRNNPLEFTIAPGASLRNISEELASSGVNFEPWKFNLLARMTMHSASIKAGSYLINFGITPVELLNMVTRGNVNLSRVLLIEGSTFLEIRAQLNAHPDLKHDIKNMTDKEVLQAIEVSEISPEGIFFPDTYYFEKQSSDLIILRRAYDTMWKKLSQEWDKRDKNLAYISPYKALIMASIIEKESGRKDDRANIASVLVNRLRLGMPLQVDPTVIFGMGTRFKGNLQRHDLRIDTPYNTYTRSGLPPTPISAPSATSIYYSMHPPETKYLYFVARGDGTTQFSKTLAEHNRAVMEFQSNQNSEGK